ncbi:MAG: hypothetical protein ACI959_001498 [Limisphaerales bacterium]|jgi:uncharacterized protein (TIGR00255 family)
MVISMTGFGRAAVEQKTRTINVEIRSLNNKYLDLTLRLPQEFRFREMELRKIVQPKLVRGKVDLTITIDSAGADDEHVLNPNAIRYYYKALSGLNDELGVQTQDMMSVIMSLPNVTMPPKAGDVEEEWAMITQAVEDACKRLMEFRTQEGNNTTKDLSDRVNNIASLRDEVITADPQRAARIRERIDSQIQDITKPGGLDENRFEQEMIYYLEKLDINEELVRLNSHIDYFLETLNAQGIEKGKKLGFVSQEMGREINTIGSKANHAGIQQLVVQMKDELEKIKEQSLNIV